MSICGLCTYGLYFRPSSPFFLYIPQKGIFVGQKLEVLNIHTLSDNVHVKLIQNINAHAFLFKKKGGTWVTELVCAMLLIALKLEAASIKGKPQDL